MIISFENKCKGLENLLKKVSFEDRDYALSHLLYVSLLQCISFNMKEDFDEDEEIRIS